MKAIIDRLGGKTTVGLSLVSGLILARSRMLRMLVATGLAAYGAAQYLGTKGYRLPGWFPGARR